MAKFQKVVLAFKIYYLLYLLLAFNAFVNGHVFMDIATWVLTIAGIGIVVGMAVQFKLYLSMKNIWIILLFIASYAVSAFLNSAYGITGNLKDIIWITLLMLLLYVSGHRYTVKEMEWELCILSVIWVVYCTVVNVVSISMLGWGRNYPIVDGPGAVRVIGFKWGRLWGIYDDPNHGATIAVAAIILSLYLVVKSKNKVVKIFWAVTMVIQYAYIILSDSRTGTVAIFVGIFCWTVATTKDVLEKKHAKRRYAISILFAVLIAGILAVGTYQCKKEYNKIEKKIQIHLAKNPQKKPTLQVGRKKDLQKDTSNGRTRIWESGLEIAKSSPIYGVSFRNMVSYAEQNLPDTYIVKNKERVKYDSLHNSIMDVVVSQGLIGIAILIALVANTLVSIRQRISHVPKQYGAIMSASFAIIASMGVSSMFLSLVFYLNAPQTYIFWLCFGYFMAILQKKETIDKAGLR